MIQCCISYMRYAFRCFFEPTIAEEKTQTLAATHGPFSLASRRVGMAARRPTMRTRSCTPQTKAWFSTQLMIYSFWCVYIGGYSIMRERIILHTIASGLFSSTGFAAWAGPSTSISTRIHAQRSATPITL